MFDRRNPVLYLLSGLLDTSHLVHARLSVGSIRLLVMAGFVCLPALRADTTQSSSGTSLPAATPVDPRQKAEVEEFLKLLWEGDISKAVDMSPEFRRLRFDDRGELITYKMTGSDGELRLLSSGFRRRVGAFQKAISFRNRKFADRTVLEVRCQWERAVMLNRFLFDDQGRIEGYWLAKAPGEPVPESFSHNGYMLGVEMCRVSGRCGAIPVRVVHAQGKSPGLAGVTLWAALPKDATQIDSPFLERNMSGAVHSSKDLHPTVWTDPQTSRRWVCLTHNSTRLGSSIIHSPARVRSVLPRNPPYVDPEGSVGFNMCFERLLPGEYLVTVRWDDDSPRSSETDDPTLTDPWGRGIDAKSSVIHLDLSKSPEPISIVVP